MSELQTLLDLGFPETRSRKALRHTNNRGAQDAIEWLLAHADDADIDDPEPAATTHATSTDAVQEGDVDQQAMSLYCVDCNKRFRTSQDCEAHAARTQHVNFAESKEEIKPLTEEEKRMKVAELQQKLQEKRAQRAAEEAHEELLKEKTRRMTGQEIAEAKRLREEVEMKKILAQKKKEMEDDAKAKARVKELLAKDKAERAALKAGHAPVVQPVAPPPAQTSQATPAAAPTTCRLQIRLLSGSPLTNIFEASAPLHDVFAFVTSKSGYVTPYNLVLMRPHRVLTTADAHTSLLDLGLAPSAVLAVAKQ